VHITSNTIDQSKKQVQKQIAMYQRSDSEALTQFRSKWNKE